MATDGRSSEAPVLPALAYGQKVEIVFPISSDRPAEGFFRGTVLEADESRLIIDNRAQLLAFRLGDAGLTLMREAFEPEPTLLTNGYIRDPKARELQNLRGRTSSALPVPRWGGNRPRYWCPDLVL